MSTLIDQIRAIVTTITIKKTIVRPADNNCKSSIGIENSYKYLNEKQVIRLFMWGGVDYYDRQ
jgi:hypothetical protein